MDAFEYLLSHTRVGRTRDCWVWIGTKNKAGYGQCKAHPFRGWSAHRAMFTLIYGPIPKSKFVLHSCDNPSCVNPSHLHLGDHRTNMSEMVARGRSRKGDTPGLKMGRRLASRQRAIPFEVCQKVRDLYSMTTLTQKEIADLFGISQQSVSMIVHGKF